MYSLSKSSLLIVLACWGTLSSCSKESVTNNGGGGGTTTPTPVPPATTITVSTIAGKLGDRGNAEDGQGAAARLWNPTKMVFDYRNNTLYVADGTAIRSIDAANNVKTYVPLGVNSGFNEILDMDLAPGAVGGSLYLSTHENDLVKIEPNGNTVTITVIIDRIYGGNATGTINTADHLDAPNGVATGKNGDIYFFNTSWNNLRRVSLTDNKVSPFAGKPTETRGGTAWPFNDGQGATASFGGAVPDIASDANGNIYVADFRNDVVRKVTPDGQVSSLFQYKDAGGIDLDGPVATAEAYRVTQVAAARDGSAIFFTTYGKGGYNLPALRMVIPGDKVVTLVKSLQYGDGPAASAGIKTPGGIAATPDGKVIYISEPGNKVIRKVVIGN